MLDVLNSHLQGLTEPRQCVVGKWIDELPELERNAFLLLVEARANAQKLYGNLLKSGVDMPFKITVFRMHMKGYCTCQSA